MDSLPGFFHIFDLDGTLLDQEEENYGFDSLDPKRLRNVDLVRKIPPGDRMLLTGRPVMFRSRVQALLHQGRCSFKWVLFWHLGMLDETIFRSLYLTWKTG